jgi:NAD(P)-dependent dehydrogenase (short-subunit alcohol dehydrogenase family)
MRVEFRFEGRTAVVTGGGGAICGAIAEALAEHGAAVAIWDISQAAGAIRVDRIRKSGGRAVAFRCDAADPRSVQEAAASTVAELGTIDILVNGAGGAVKQATTSPELAFFDIEPAAMAQGLALNYLSAFYPSQAVGRVFADRGRGVILNISSIAGFRPLSRSICYSNAKAAMNSFTQWLAVHMARAYSPSIRVNAIAPGFMITEQNRFLLIDVDTGSLTERGQRILDQVPMGRYGNPEEVVGAALWLVSDQASFVTGAIIPVDGGFSAASGV